MHTENVYGYLVVFEIHIDFALTLHSSGRVRQNTYQLEKLTYNLYIVIVIVFVS